MKASAYRGLALSTFVVLAGGVFHPAMSGDLASCKNENLQGQWRLIFNQSSSAYCELGVKKTGKIKGSACYQAKGIPAAIALSGAFKLKKNCNVRGEVQFATDEVVDLAPDMQLSEDRSTIIGPMNTGPEFIGAIIQRFK